MDGRGLLTADRQTNLDGGAGARLRVNLDGAVVKIDSAQGQWQAQAAAALFGGVVEVEDSAGILDSGTLICDTNFDEVVRQTPAADRQTPSPRHRFHRVCDDIAQGLGQ